MQKIPDIPMDAFRYDLPPERIAQQPLPRRDASKLLVYRHGDCLEESFSDIPNYLSSNDLLVFNNTRVIQARLQFQKPTGAGMEIFLLEPIAPSADFSVALEQTREVSWRCLLGNARRWNDPSYQIPVFIQGRKIVLTASGKKPLNEGTFAITFSWDHAAYSFGQLLEACGDIPLPPYIRRKTTPEDQIRYQTLMARFEGSVAAPTAGLHFSEAVLQRLSSKGIHNQCVTLHVGLGTFRPISTPSVTGHVMHQERFTVSKQTIEALLHHRPGRIVAVGTTAVRTLESLYWLGARLINQGISPLVPLDQWIPYETEVDTEVTTEKALKVLIETLEAHHLDDLPSETRLMIVPGYQFRIIEGMVTNFHQPGSSLLLLVAAFLGKDWKKVYDFALMHDFRFLSYGDACLFL